jgi:hypothetical protein
MDDYFKTSGYLKVYRVREGYTELLHQHKNTINNVLLNNLAQAMISRSVDYGVDAIAWGSYVNAGGTYVDGTYCGTTGLGTGGGLVQGRIANLATYTGTFSFSTTKLINMFRMGRGYTAPAGGVTELFTSLYTYDNSLLTGSTNLTYVTGDLMIINWSVQIG